MALIYSSFRLPSQEVDIINPLNQTLLDGLIGVQEAVDSISPKNEDGSPKDLSLVGSSITEVIDGNDVFGDVEMVSSVGIEDSTDLLVPILGGGKLSKCRNCGILKCKKCTKYDSSGQFGITRYVCNECPPDYRTVENDDSVAESHLNVDSTKALYKTVDNSIESNQIVESLYSTNTDSILESFKELSISSAIEGTVLITSGNTGTTTVIKEITPSFEKTRFTKAGGETVISAKALGIDGSEDVIESLTGGGRLFKSNCRDCGRKRCKKCKQPGDTGWEVTHYFCDNCPPEYRSVETNDTLIESHLDATLDNSLGKTKEFLVEEASIIETLNSSLVEPFIEGIISLKDDYVLEDKVFYSFSADTATTRVSQEISKSTHRELLADRDGETVVSAKALGLDASEDVIESLIGLGKGSNCRDCGRFRCKKCTKYDPSGQFGITRYVCDTCPAGYKSVAANDVEVESHLDATLDSSIYKTKEFVVSENAVIESLGSFDIPTSLDNLSLLLEDGIVESTTVFVSGATGTGTTVSTFKRTILDGSDNRVENKFIDTNGDEIVSLLQTVDATYLHDKVLKIADDGIETGSLTLTGLTSGSSKEVLVVDVDGKVGKTEITSDVANTLFVDPIYGDDGEGEGQRFDKPFKTIQAAINAAVAGDTVVVRAGTYVIPQLNLKDSVNVHFEMGAILKNSSPFGRLIAYDVPGGSGTVNITGYANIMYNGTQQTLRFRGNSLNINIEVYNISFTARGLAAITEGPDWTFNMHVHKNITVDDTSVYYNPDTFMTATGVGGVTHTKDWHLSWGGEMYTRRVFQINASKNMTIQTKGTVSLVAEEGTLSSPSNSGCKHIHRGDIYSYGAFTDPYDVDRGFGVVSQNQGDIEFYGNIYTVNQPAVKPVFSNGNTKLYNSTIYGENVVPIWHLVDANGDGKIEFHNCHISDGVGNTLSPLVQSVNDPSNAVEQTDLLFYSCHFEKNSSYAGTGGVIVRDFADGESGLQKLLFFNCTIKAATNQDITGTNLVGTTNPIEFYFQSVTSNKALGTNTVDVGPGTLNINNTYLP